MKKIITSVFAITLLSSCGPIAPMFIEDEKTIPEETQTIVEPAEVQQEQKTEYLDQAEQDLIKLQELLEKKKALEGGDQSSLLNLFIGNTYAEELQVNAEATVELTTEEQIAALEVEIAALTASIQVNTELALEEVESAVTAEEATAALEAVAELQSLVVDTLTDAATENEEVAALLEDTAASLETVDSTVVEIATAEANEEAFTNVSIETSVEELVGGGDVNIADLVKRFDRRVIAERKQMKAENRLQDFIVKMMEDGISQEEIDAKVLDIKAQQEKVQALVAEGNFKAAAREANNAVNQAKKEFRNFEKEKRFESWALANPEQVEERKMQMEENQAQAEMKKMEREEARDAQKEERKMKFEESKEMRKAVQEERKAFDDNLREQVQSGDLTQEQAQEMRKEKAEDSREERKEIQGERKEFQQEVNEMKRELKEEQREEMKEKAEDRLERLEEKNPEAAERMGERMEKQEDRVEQRQEVKQEQREMLKEKVEAGDITVNQARKIEQVQQEKAQEKQQEVRKAQMDRLEENHPQAAEKMKEERKEIQEKKVEMKQEFRKENKEDREANSDRN